MVNFEVETSRETRGCVAAYSLGALFYPYLTVRITEHRLDIITGASDDRCLGAVVILGFGVSTWE